MTITDVTDEFDNVLDPVLHSPLNVEDTSPMEPMSNINADQTLSQANMPPSPLSSAGWGMNVSGFCSTPSYFTVVARRDHVDDADDNSVERAVDSVWLRLRDAANGQAAKVSARDQL